MFDNIVNVFAEGPDTKLALNQKGAPSKFTHVERRLNRYVVWIFFFLVLICLFGAGCSYYWRVNKSFETRFFFIDPFVFSFPLLNEFCVVFMKQATLGNDAWYLQLPQSFMNELTQTALNALTFFILLNFFIPISLYVSIELCKVCIAAFIQNDLQLYDEQKNMRINVKTVNMIEELGQVISNID